MKHGEVTRFNCVLPFSRSGSGCSTLPGCVLWLVGCKAGALYGGGGGPGGRLRIFANAGSWLAIDENDDLYFSGNVLDNYVVKIECER